ncbi:hypothetical protein J6R97_03360 [bacterium]|nr:hypothetical protein [bacterium]
MVYTILISIVFIAELIIAITVIQNILKLDKAIINLNEKITALKPSILDISMLTRKISEQLEIISQDIFDKAKENAENIFLKQFSKALLGMLVVRFNFKLVKNIRKSKIAKIVTKSLSILENMV